MNNNDYITLKNNQSVLKTEYISAKTKDLIDFGINTTEKDVEDQLEKVLNNGLLNMVGMFIADDFE